MDSTTQRVESGYDSDQSQTGSNYMRHPVHLRIFWNYIQWMVYNKEWRTDKIHSLFFAILDLSKYKQLAQKVEYSCKQLAASFIRAKHLMTNHLINPIRTGPYGTE